MILRDFVVWIGILSILETWGWAHPFPLHPPDTPIIKPEGATASESQFRICGPRIKEMVKDICRARSYSPKGRPQRQIMSFMGSSEEFLPRRSYRSVIEECCWNNCTVRKLLRYCGNSNIPIPTVEEPRYVPLQTFLQKLAEFFKQVESPNGHLIKVKAWDETRDVGDFEFDDSSEVYPTTQPGPRKGKSIYSDEIPQDFEEFSDSRIHRASHHPSIVQVYESEGGGRTGRQIGYVSGIQEIRTHERPEAAVVITDTM